MNKKGAIPLCILSGKSAGTQNDRELVFSVVFCYNGISENPPSRREPWDALVPLGVWALTEVLCNTKAKLAIKQNYK